ncbi:Putative methyltransferase [Faustovirus ST1]|nr:Putative methyltransferase [Faustovirus ST1]
MAILELLILIIIGCVAILTGFSDTHPSYLTSTINKQITGAFDNQPPTQIPYKQTRDNIIDTPMLNINTTVPETTQLLFKIPSNETNPTYGNYPLGDKMNELKERLNGTKLLLDDYYKKPLFDKIMLKLDPYARLKSILTRRYNAQHCTNAWLKYYEIYSKFGVIEKIAESDNIVSFHNAELPGASICAFNHYMKTNLRQHDFDWYASSLLADDSRALSDVYRLYECNPEHWLMSSGFRSPRKEVSVSACNGDTTLLANIDYYKAHIGGRVNLYSHDAGVDASSDYNNQEDMNSKVHLGAALAGLETLKNGGVFIAKQYTYFSDLTIYLMTKYATMFKEFYIFKPLTSRACNSETYFIGIGYTRDETTIDHLRDLLQNFESKVSSINLDEVNDQIKQVLYESAKDIFEQQIRCLQNRYEMYKEITNAYAHEIEELPNVVVGMVSNYAYKTFNPNQQLWIESHPVIRLNDSDKLKDNC